MTQFAHSLVRPYNGVPTIFVDDQPMHGMTATSVAFGSPEVVTGFVDGGVEIMMIWIEIALKCWKAPGVYDWTYAEEKLTYFEEHSNDTKWLLRVRLGLIDPWWGRAHPTEVHSLTPDCTLVAAIIHSSIWLAEITPLVTAFVNWVKTTRWAPRIIGFMFNAGSTEEWLAFDAEAMSNGHYQPIMARELREWLRENYNDDAALQEAWHSDKVTFDNATPPQGMMRRGSHIWGPFTLRDPKLDRPAIDYYRFLNERLSDALIHICRTAKAAAGTPIICGGFHSYLWWETGVYSYIQEYGHGLVQRLNSSPYVDFISDITSYDDRYPGGPSGYLGLAACQNLHNTLHYTEVDLTTHLNMPAELAKTWDASNKEVAPGTAEPILPDRIWKWDCGMCGRDEEETKAVLQREVAHNLITGTAYWWFDIKAGSYQSPGLTAEMRRLSDLGKQAVQWDRSSLAEVAFVCSEETPFYQSSMNGSLLRFEMEAAHALLIDGCNKKWGLAGVPFDCYELHDLAHPNFPGDQYKLIIFVNCAKISDEAAKGIKRWQNNQRTLLWTFSAGAMGEDHIDPSDRADLLGIKLGWHNERRLQRIEMSESTVEGAPNLPGQDYGTDIAIGPVFYVDDPKAQVMGHLQPGGEAAYGWRRHADWNALYLSLPNFGSQALRDIARWAGAHIWCQDNDVLYANNSLLCLHSATAGKKVVNLPAGYTARDLDTNEVENSRTLTVEMPAYRTRLWQLLPPT